MKQLDGGTELRICPECHSAVLETRSESPWERLLKCPLCGFAVLNKRRLKENESNEPEPKQSG